MPVPALNIINGGSHAGNKLAMQVLDVKYLNVPALAYKDFSSLKNIEIFTTIIR